MRVLMLGWEFPPWISGGLGTACHGLTHALTRRGVEVLFVLPRKLPVAPSNHLCMLGVGVDENPGREAGGVGVAPQESWVPIPGVTFKTVASHVTSPYATRPEVGPHSVASTGAEFRRDPGTSSDPLDDELAGYEGDMLTHVRRYARLCDRAVERENFDVIHAHDWMTWPAGLRIARRTGRPVVVHVHSIEHDRSGDYSCEPICRVERVGLHGADHVVCVSRHTLGRCVERYAMPSRKASVVYNGIDTGHSHEPRRKLSRTGKLVLFLGRVTSQKGPEYFLRAAKRVLEKMPGVVFVMAGDGDQLPPMRDLARRLGLEGSVIFTGFLTGEEVDRAYELADVFVMPSVSEPFGITALEAVVRGVPVIVSRHSGVCETMENVLKVDFWDARDIADKILAVLRRPVLQNTLRQGAIEEVKSLPWDSAAEKCVTLYQNLTHRG